MGGLTLSLVNAVLARSPCCALSFLMLYSTHTCPVPAPPTYHHNAVRLLVIKCSQDAHHPGVILQLVHHPYLQAQSAETHPRSQSV
jgi:hypothetical protein